MPSQDQDRSNATLSSYVAPFLFLDFEGGGFVGERTDQLKRRRDKYGSGEDAQQIFKEKVSRVFMIVIN